MSDLPLLKLFVRLREAGIQLGVDDYELVLQALQAGYGFPDRKALARLCQTLWIKSTDDLHLFNYYFEQIIGNVSEQPFDLRHLSPRQTGQEPSDNVAEKGQQQPKWKPRLVILAILGVLLGGLGVWFVSERLRTPSQVPDRPTSQPFNWNNQIYWTIFVAFLLVVALVTGHKSLFKLWAQLFNHRDLPPPFPPEPSKSASTTALSSNVISEIKDEVQAAQIVQKVNKTEEPLREQFLFAADYLPITQRQMKQSWRYLRRMVRAGACTELDVEATVRHIGCQGIFLDPVLVPRRINRAELLLLIDEDGSMVPFRSLSRRLVDTALRGGKLGEVGVYYFHNCPVDYLFRDPTHQTAEPIQTVFAKLQKEQTVVLIFSDAGAARGGLSEERVELTRDFLKLLKQRTRHVVWLNPMPKSRWRGTTADEIAHLYDEMTNFRLVQMFEASRRGFQAAIDALRGRSKLWKEQLRSKLIE